MKVFKKKLSLSWNIAKELNFEISPEDVKATLHADSDENMNH